MAEPEFIAVIDYEHVSGHSLAQEWEETVVGDRRNLRQDLGIYRSPTDGGYSQKLFHLLGKDTESGKEDLPHRDRQSVLAADHGSGQFFDEEGVALGALVYACGQAVRWPVA